MKKNKIILIGVLDYRILDTPLVKDLYLPLGILYLGTFLHNRGFSVKLLDTRLYHKDSFLRVLRSELEDAILVGLSVMTPNVGNGLAITKYIRDNAPSLKIVWGGIHATLFPDSTIRSEHIDFVIIKEGEKGLLELARFLSGQTTDIAAIPNLIFKKEGSVIKNTSEKQEDLALIGRPEYGLIDMELYVSRAVSVGKNIRVAELITSRGCPHRCSFCVNTIIKQSICRHEPLQQTLENIDYLIGRYNVEHIFFIDEDFFADRKITKELLGEFKRRRFSWESNCRVDYINDVYINNKFLALLRESGCIKLRFGAESGSQQILNLLKKDITVEQTVHAAAALTPHGIIPSFSFMMGIPGEGLKDIKKTMGLITRLFRIDRNIDFVGPLVFRPYPGSELFERCKESGLAIPVKLDEWSDFFIHNLLNEYKGSLPWITYDNKIFAEINLFHGFLRMRPKSYVLRWLIVCMLRFHILTSFKFIRIHYSGYKLLKRLLKRLRAG